jgi:ParB-like nuclease domain
MTPINPHTREVPIESLVIDPRFAGLFIEEPATIDRIARSMRHHGYDPHRPIDVWKDGAGRGRHVVVEGHQRLAAAKRAGLAEVKIAYRHFDGFGPAFVWSAEQQTNRRNASKEAQALSILRALKRAGEGIGTTADMSERFGFSTATIDRARQVLARGTESEIVAVLEGKHGLKDAYDLIRKREKADAEGLPEEPKRRPEVEDDEDDPAAEPDIDAPEELTHVRDLVSTAGGRLVRLEDLLLAENVPDVLDDVRDRKPHQAIEQLRELLDELEEALATLADLAAGKVSA